MKKPLLYLALVSAFLLIAGYGYWNRGREGVEYITAKVSRGDIAESVTASGVLNPLVTVQVGSQVTGRIKNLFADFNSAVKKGDIVAEIDPEPFQAKVDAGRANLAAQYAASLAARANLGKSRVDLTQAARNFKRAEDLFHRGIVSESQLDGAQASSDVASAQVNAQEALYKTALAQVEQARANLKSAESDLGYTRIISPVDGIVISRAVDVGQTVSASLQAPTLFVIAEDLAKMQVSASVVEADIGRVSSGQRADFTVDAFPNIKFDGTVAQIRNSPVTVQNVVTYDVIIEVENAGLRLKPGMTANVSILAARQKGALLAPSAAFRFRPAAAHKKSPHARAGADSPRESHAGAGAEIWILSKDGDAISVRVEAGLSDGNFTEIKSGTVKEGDSVIIGAVSDKRDSPAAARPPRFGF
ncbi:MAG: efflux RND transporter periplasmic adaptor subunit [Deltaproteobacteria bacterium]